MRKTTQLDFMIKIDGMLVSVNLTCNDRDKLTSIFHEAKDNTSSVTAYKFFASFLEAIYGHPIDCSVTGPDSPTE